MVEVKVVSSSWSRKVQTTCQCWVYWGTLAASWEVQNSNSTILAASVRNE